MQIKINETEIKCDTDEKNLLDILNQLQQEYISDNEVLIAIELDGQDLDSDSLSRCKYQPANDFKSIHIHCQSRQSYASYGLNVMADRILASDYQRQQAAELLQQGNTTAAMEKMIEYLAIWSTMQETLASACRLMNVDFAQLEIAGIEGCLADHTAELMDKLSEIKTALQSGDLVLLGDVMEYEFPEIAKQWQNILETLAKYFQKD